MCKILVHYSLYIVVNTNTDYLHVLSPLLSLDPTLTPTTLSWCSAAFYCWLLRYPLLPLTALSWCCAAFHCWLPRRSLLTLTTFTWCLAAFYHWLLRYPLNRAVCVGDSQATGVIWLVGVCLNGSQGEEECRREIVRNAITPAQPV